MPHFPPRPGRPPRAAAFPLVLAALLIGAGVPSAAADPEDGLTELRTRHYRVYSDLPEEEAADLGEHMDRMFDAFARFLRRLEGDTDGLQDLYLLRDEAGYLRTLEEAGIDATGTGGMFFWGGGDTGLATWVEGRPREQVISTLQHEGFHQFAYLKTDDDLPKWLNEGLAEYFGDAVVLEDRVHHGVVRVDRLERLRRANAESVGLPFAELVDIDPEDWRENMTSGSPLGSLQYDQSWAVVHFLIHANPEVERRFSEYLVKLSRNVRHRRAFREAFGEDLRPMERAFRRFLADLEPDPFAEGLSRLRFLSEGLRFLHAQDAPAPADLAALEAALRGARFRVGLGTHGVGREVTADDASLYRYEAASGGSEPFVLEASDDPALPPAVAAPGLDPPARIRWRRDRDGRLVSELSFN